MDIVFWPNPIFARESLNTIHCYFKTQSDNLLPKKLQNSLLLFPCSLHPSLAPNTLLPFDSHQYGHTNLQTGQQIWSVSETIHQAQDKPASLPETNTTRPMLDTS